MDTLTEEQIKEMIYSTKLGPYSEDFKRRKLKIFHADGYDIPTYRTTFVSVEGSPNKLSAIINKVVSGNTDIYEVVTHKGGFVAVELFDQKLKRIKSKSMGLGL